mmetsp:Transcript_30896/g.98635  ORF Transcript_30896/g.98635 Transcript_30896/m.98635 type:complete len:345 (-) Transcript_30896:360-1394(-)
MQRPGLPSPRTGPQISRCQNLPGDTGLHCRRARLRWTGPWLRLWLPGLWSLRGHRRRSRTSPWRQSRRWPRRPCVRQGRARRPSQQPAQFCTCRPGKQGSRPLTARHSAAAPASGRGRSRFRRWTILRRARTRCTCRWSSSQTLATPVASVLQRGHGAHPCGLPLHGGRAAVSFSAHAWHRSHAAMCCVQPLLNFRWPQPAPQRQPWGPWKHQAWQRQHQRRQQQATQLSQSQRPALPRAPSQTRSRTRPTALRLLRQAAMLPRWRLLQPWPARVQARPQLRPRPLYHPLSPRFSLSEGLRPGLRPLGWMQRPPPLAGSSSSAPARKRLRPPPPPAASSSSVPA